MSEHRDDAPGNLTSEKAIIDALRAQFAPLVAALLTPETEPALTYHPAFAENDAHT